jgi:hypothetical protein
MVNVPNVHDVSILVDQNRMETAFLPFDNALVHFFLVEIAIKSQIPVLAFSLSRLQIYSDSYSKAL